MAWYVSGSLMFGMIVCGIALGLPVAFAFLVANIVGVLLFMGGLAGIPQLVDNATGLLTSFVLIPLPMFLLMGELFFHSGLALRVFDAIDKLLGRLPGRLSYLAVAGGAVFSTLTGSTIANTAMLGTLLVPEMNLRGYKTYMSVGPILGTGGLAMIIPPSGLAVLLGTIAIIDISALLIAGLIPGFILATLYGGLIFLQVKLDPEAAPQYPVEPIRLRTKITLVGTNILPMGLILFAVVGLIIMGITTPSEAAAFGVLGVAIVAACFRSLTFGTIKKSLIGTLRVAGMAFLILMGASTFSQILSVSGASSGLIAWAGSLELSPLGMLILMFVVILILGTLMDSLSIMLLTIPIFFPLAESLGYDAIWFGIIMLLGLEMSLTTPPFGILLYIMLGVAPQGTTLPQVAGAAAPFLICDLILVALLIAFPLLALYLPRVMVGQ